MNRRVISKEAQARIAELRARLEWKDLENMDPNRSRAPAIPELPDEDEGMFAVVISDVLRGVDISHRYPGFLEKIQADSNLKSAFLEALDLLESSYQGKLAPLPQPPHLDLGFLASGVPAQRLEWNASAGWRVNLSQGVAYLQNLFFPPGLPQAMAVREDMNYYEETRFTLMQGDIELESGPLLALLEAAQPLDAPDVLRVSLQLGLERQATEDLPELRARVIWGDYSADARVNADGQAVFPDIPLAAVLDRNGMEVREGLELVLEARGE